MRLNRFIALATGLSRRAADDLVEDSRIDIDGKPANLGDIVSGNQRVSLDGEQLELQPLQTIMLNKPVKYVTSRQRQGSTPTIYDLLPTQLHHLKPVGRLDKDSSGLLLLTNDGDLAQELSHPSGSKWKTYIVKLNRKLSTDDKSQLEKGVELEDGISRLKIKPAAGGYQVELQEGRNRQIRRSFSKLGYEVTSLHRETIGSFELGELPPGHWQTVGVAAL